ncbi:MAG: hypothetical protein AAB511_04345 [Patescibacteria group bacterium]
MKDNFDANFDGTGHEEEFDPTDSWDAHLVSIGKGFFDSNAEHGAVRLDTENFEDGVCFVAGRTYDDGFGAWNPGDGEWSVDKPETIIPFDERFIDGTYRAQVDFVASGSPDGPGSKGHVWAVRLWDRKKDKEIPGTRVFAAKLSHAVALALSKAPEWALEMKTKEEKDKELRRQIWFMAPRFDKVLGEIAKRHSEVRLYPPYQEVLREGGCLHWVAGKLLVGAKLEDLIKHLNSIRQYAHELALKQQKQDEMLQDQSSDEGDEGDGWMQAPDWRK